MKRMTWSDRMAWSVAVLAASSLLWFGFVGCSQVKEIVKELPPIEFCYVHETYGEVCVQIGGELFFKATLTPAQKAEVEEWVKTQRP